MNKNTTSIIIGGFLVLIGAGFLFDSLNLLNFGRTIALLWPLFIIALAVTRFSVADYKGGIIMTLIGALFLLSTFGILAVSTWQLLWPLVFIYAGLGILFRSGFKSDLSDTTKFNELTLFGGMKRIVTAKGFTAGVITILFGGSEIDLRETEFAREGAVLDILCLFGGVEIKVPANTKVIHQETAIFGGSDDKRMVSSDSQDQKTLTIRGFMAFGGIEVK